MGCIKSQSSEVSTTELQSIQTSIKELSNGLSAFKTEVTSKLDAIEKDIGTIKDKHERMESRIQDIEARLNTLEQPSITNNNDFINIKNYSTSGTNSNKVSSVTQKDDTDPDHD